MPALLVLAVEGKCFDDVLVDVVEGDHAGARLLDGHGDQGDVGVVGLGVAEVAALLEGGWLGEVGGARSQQKGHDGIGCGGACNVGRKHAV